MNDPLIRMSSIKKSYDGKKNILDGIDFSLGTGEIAVIYGESGCGKSTFLNVVGLLDSINEGSYFFDNNKISARRLNTYSTLRARDIGFVFQSYCLIEPLSVRDNILMPFVYNGKPLSKQVMSELNQISSELGIDSLLGKKAALLSGGEKQRVAIARAMIKHPKLIIADEPTGNLDEVNSNIVAAALSRAAENGAAVLIVTHDRQLNYNNAKVYLLNDGRLIQVEK